MTPNQFIVGNAVEVLSACSRECVDLTVTSPPYDDLRVYNGYSFDAGEMLEAIHHATVDGGVCVWVVGEKIKNGRSLTSFEHAFIGRDAGWVVHDVMIYQKKNTPFVRNRAYTNCYELMIVFCKGPQPRTFNPLKDKTKRRGWETAVSNKGPDAKNIKRPVELKAEKTRTNIWRYAVGMGGTTRDKIAFQHPAVFPEKLAEDHILSWSNPGDLVLDPMCGSGTTPKMADRHDRRWVGIDMSEEYIGIAKRRMEQRRATETGTLL